MSLPKMAGKKGRRKLDIQNKDLLPYRKKPRVTAFFYDSKDFLSNKDLSAPSRKLDFLWMVMHALGMEGIPMWTGFIGQTYTDHLPKQSVLYMPNISQSPTSNDVVETLCITQQCAEECGEPYGIVTYDLDIAQRAIKIQMTEQPRFDSIFIMFGVFYVQMCLFRSIGKIIKESGMTEMLV